MAPCIDKTNLNTRIAAIQLIIKNNIQTLAITNATVAVVKA